MKTRLPVNIILLLSLANIGFGQSNIPVGTWRTHFSYDNVLRVASTEGGNKIYAATANALFYVDQEDNSINKITKIDGLSDAGISSLKSTVEILAIGYSSGTIDFLEGNEITEFSDLAIAPQLEERTIYDIEFLGERIYIATSVGVVVVNQSTKDIIESYVEIGPGASTHLISDITLSVDSIYLATPIGMLVASLDPTLNLQDFNNWHLRQPLQNSNALNQVRFINGEIWASNGRQLFSYRNGVWDDISNQLGNGGFDRIRLANNSNYAITERTNQESIIFDENLAVIDRYIGSIRDATGVPSNLFVGSLGDGLIASSQGNQSSLAPSGPHTDQLEKLDFNAGRMIAISEFQDFLERPLGNPAIYSSFENGDWQRNQLNELADISSAAGEYFGLYGTGIFNGTTGELIDEQTPGSPLIPAPDQAFGPLITELYQDSEGATWVANYDASPSVHVLSSAGEWNSVSLGNGNSARFPIGISTSDLTEAAWINIERSRGGGIYVYDPNQPAVRYVTRSGSSIPSNQVNQLAIDKNDEVWLATSAGVAFFQSSLSPFIPDFSEAIIPIFDGDLLLKDEFISSVAIDGGNRKWLGTRLGLWLFSENGNELVHHFTKANSPLPSDTIEHITINPLSGEVFIATTKGLVSYRSDATDAGPTFTDVKVFPNPVTPDYRGTIGISGLASDV
ncbi:MAG: hypothetical protein AAGC88_02225, partial [Bacteroidota bacterium]